MCFCFTSNENCRQFSSEKTATSQNGLLIFFGKETNPETKSRKTSRILTKSYNNNGKPWNSSRILRVNPNFFIFHCSSFFFIFLLPFFFHFSCSFFHCFLFCNVFHFFVFSFLHFLHFSSFFFFSAFSSFFFIVLHSSSFFFSFSFSFLGCSKSDFFGPQLLQNFLYYFLKKTFFEASREVPLWVLFSFFSSFFLPFFSCLIFSFFSCFVHFFIFCFFYVFHFSFFLKKNVFFLFFFPVFLSNMFYCWH